MKLVSHLLLQVVFAPRTPNAASTSPKEPTEYSTTCARLRASHNRNFKFETIIITIDSTGKRRSRAVGINSRIYYVQQNYVGKKLHFDHPIIYFLVSKPVPSQIYINIREKTALEQVKAGSMSNKLGTR